MKKRRDKYGRYAREGQKGAAPKRDAKGRFIPSKAVFKKKGSKELDPQAIKKDLRDSLSTELDSNVSVSVDEHSLKARFIIQNPNENAEKWHDYRIDLSDEVAADDIDTIESIATVCLSILDEYYHSRCVIRIAARTEYEDGKTYAEDWLTITGKDSVSGAFTGFIGDFEGFGMPGGIRRYWITSVSSIGVDVQVPQWYKHVGASNESHSVSKPRRKKGSRSSSKGSSRKSHASGGRSPKGRRQSRSRKAKTGSRKSR